MDFEEWAAALETLKADFASFCAELGLDAPAPAPAPASASVAAQCDAFEDATRRLEAGVADARTSPDRRRIEKGMSRTFSENVGALEARLQKSLARALDCMARAAAAALRAGARARSALPLAPHGAVATNLLLGSMICNGSPLLGQMATIGLGGTPDSVQDLIDDTETLSAYHATQAIGFMPCAGAGSGAGESTSASVSAGALDLTLPDATYATKYNLSALVGRRQPAALLSATTTTGLSHPIVVALRTIYTVPLPERAPPARVPAIAHGPVMVTTDRVTEYPLVDASVWAGAGAGAGAGASAGASAWAPLAGASPRAALYARLCDATAEPSQAEAGDAPELSPDAVVETLVRFFDREFDGDGEAYHDLVMAPPTPAGFVGRAAAALIEDALRPHLRALAARPAAPRSAERELRLSQAVRVADLTADLGRRLRREFRPAEKQFAAEFRRLAGRAAATPVYGITPSLKLQALLA